MSNGLEENWCKSPDSGLPKPHIVLFMDISPERAAQRAGFGDELYEKVEF
jgi:dTMP kinase